MQGDLSLADDKKQENAPNWGVFYLGNLYLPYFIACSGVVSRKVATKICLLILVWNLL